MNKQKYFLLFRFKKDTRIQDLYLLFHQVKNFLDVLNILLIKVSNDVNKLKKNNVFSKFVSVLTNYKDHLNSYAEAGKNLIKFIKHRPGELSIIVET